MKLAKLTIKTATLGLAGYGAQQLWTQYRKPATTLAHETSQAIATQVAPVIQESAKSVRESSKTAASQVADATRDAAASVSNGTVGAAETETSNAPDPASALVVDDSGLVPAAAAGGTNRDANAKK